MEVHEINEVGVIEEQNNNVVDNNNVIHQVNIPQNNILENKNMEVQVVEEFPQHPVQEEYIYHNPAHVARNINITDETAPLEFNAGIMDQKCVQCGALFWDKERNKHSRDYNKCCTKGTVRLPTNRPPPVQIQLTMEDLKQDQKLF